MLFQIDFIETRVETLKGSQVRKHKQYAMPCSLILVR